MIEDNETKVAFDRIKFLTLAKRPMVQILSIEEYDAEETLVTTVQQGSALNPSITDLYMYKVNDL